MPPPSSTASPSTGPDLRRIAAWAANVVRVPFTQDFVLGGRGAANRRRLPRRARPGGDLGRGRQPEQEWHRAFGHLAAYPVFAGEWGGGPSDLAWGRQLLAYLEATTVGWTAWSWCDWPPLLADHRGGDWSPTPFGEVVRAGLLDAGSRDRDRSAAET